jgi:poly-gamma-glutamate biosynthesis protein PgsC/CapC
MLVEAIAVGLVYSFFFFEMTGLVAGGLVVPGYFAMSFDQPLVIALCLGTALLTMLLVRVLSFATILFGRRRFIVCILLAFALQWTAGALLIGSEAARGRLDVVGFIIPGLVANEMDRQGTGKTLLALLLLSGLVHLSLRGLAWLRTF